MKLFSRALSLLIISGFLAACSTASNTGPAQTKQVDVPIPGDTSQVQTIELGINAGKLNLKPGNSGLVQGTIQYNVAQLEPVVTTSGSRTVIRNGDMQPSSNAQNDWDLSIGQSIPLDLVVSTGAGDANAELGGLSLRTLKWVQGAGTQTIQFSQPNLDQLGMLIVEQAAGKATVRGLGNAQATAGTFKVNAGDLIIYADGTLKADSTITIEATTAGITIVSSGMPVRVSAKTEVGKINGGSWTQANGGYESPEWATAQGPKMTINITTTTGNITLQ